MRSHQAVYAQRQRDLTSMMQIMLDKVPDNPLARESFRFITRIIFIALLHIFEKVYL